MFMDFDVPLSNDITVKSDFSLCRVWLHFYVCLFIFFVSNALKVMNRSYTRSLTFIKLLEIQNYAELTSCISIIRKDRATVKWRTNFIFISDLFWLSSFFCFSYGGRIEFFVTWIALKKNVSMIYYIPNE